jgi:hypothetical protein
MCQSFFGIDETSNHPLLIWGDDFDIPSGKHTKNYGKSAFSMGKSTINGHFQ